MFRNVKSQNSMEVLLGFSFVMLAAIIIFVVFVRSGYLNTDMMIPDRLEMGPELPVSDVVMNDDEVTFIFKSNLGKTLYNFRVNVTQCNDGEGALSDPMTVPEGQTVVIRIVCNGSTSKGKKFKSDINVQYDTKTAGDYIEHFKQGTLLVTVAEAVPKPQKVLGVSGCMDLNESFVLYELSQDLEISTALSGDNCINITAENVVFDLKGHNIVYHPSGSNKYGVYVKISMDNATVRNGGVYGFERAIYVSNADNCTIRGMTGNTSINGVGITLISDDSVVLNNYFCDTFRGFDCTGDGNEGGGNTFDTVVACTDHSILYDPCPITCYLTESGAFDDPIQLCNCTQLQNITEMGPGKYYELAKDIDCSNTSVPGHALNNLGNGFEPIAPLTFSGTLDGRGYEISNLYINAADISEAGMFAYVSESEIKNLTLRGFNVSAVNTNTLGILAGTFSKSNISNVTIDLSNLSAVNSDFTGGLAGKLEESNLSSSLVSNVIVDAGNNVGGLIGIVKNSNVTFSAAEDVVVNGSDYVGGLIGYNDKGNVSRTHAIGEVNGTNYVGGLVGNNYGFEGYALVERSYANVDVNCSNQKAGGLVGENYYAEVNNSYTLGDVNGYTYTGGLVGRNRYSNITYSYAVGNVSTIFRYVAGLIGESNSASIVSDSFSTGNVISGVLYNGSFVGRNQGTLNNVYWNNVSENLDDCYSGGNANCIAIDNNEPYFYTVNNPPMDTWNFAIIWDLSNDGVGYPTLR